MLAWAMTEPGVSVASEKTDHFDGVRFHDAPVFARGGRHLLRWLVTRRPGEWRSVMDASPGPPPPERVAGSGLRVTFVGHATLLIQTAGLNVLTDPIWSDRASPVSWAGPRRRRPPGLRFADLPPIDLVLVSHDHYDHLDLPTLRRLSAAFAPRAVTGLGNAPRLQAAGFPGAIELDWWQEVEIASGVRLWAVPARHFSSRGLHDRNRTLWAGFVLQGPGGSVFFAGDTGAGPHFAEIRRRLGPPRAALLPIGAFRPEWFMGPVHMSPADAVQAQRDLGAGTAIAMHFGTFRLADDGQDEPVETLHRVLAGGPPPAPRFWVLGFGEGRDVPEP